MPTRFRDPIADRQPTPFWFAGVMIGLTVSTLATGAMLFGASLAVTQSVTKPK